MDTKRLALVCVDLNGEFKVGTGYLITARHVLTARHVVAQAVDGSKVTVGLEGDRTKESGFEKCWRRGKPAPNGLWLAPTDSGLDVALVELNEPVDHTMSILLHSALSPGRPKDYYGKGFPDVGVDRGRRTPVGLDGKIHVHEGHEPDLEITVSSPPADMKAWCGVSGAPLFYQDMLVGVISEVPLGFQNGRLKATSVARMRRLPTFPLTKVKDESILQEIRRQITVQLDKLGDTELRRQLSNHLFDEEHHSPGDIAEELVSKDTLNALKDLQMAAIDADVKPDTADAEALVAILKWLVILVGTRVTWEKHGTHPWCFSAGIHSQTIAEALVALIINRPTLYADVPSNGDPYGLFEVIVPPSLPGSPEAFVTQVEDETIDRFFPNWNPEWTGEERTRRLRTYYDQMLFKAQGPKNPDKRQGPLHFVFNPADFGVSPESGATAIYMDKLSERYPQLIVLAVCETDPDDADFYVGVCRIVYDLLRTYGGNGG